MKSPVTKLKGAGRFQRQREQTASDLLEAARNVLAAKGYHGTKIVDIARHAGIGVGTFYRNLGMQVMVRGTSFRSSSSRCGSSLT